MANFTYAAKDPTGKTVEGIIQASDRNEAVDMLRGQDLIVLRVDQSGKKGKKVKSPKSKSSKNLHQRRSAPSLPKSALELSSYVPLYLL